jgi:hypothetical protein
MKKIALFFVFAAVVALSTSCNRGVGCPTNFNTTKEVAK